MSTEPAVFLQNKEEYELNADPKPVKYLQWLWQLHKILLHSLTSVLLRAQTDHLTAIL